MMINDTRAETTIHNDAQEWMRSTTTAPSQDLKPLSNIEIEPKNEAENETVDANMRLAFAGASTSVEI